MRLLGLAVLLGLGCAPAPPNRQSSVPTLAISAPAAAADAAAPAAAADSSVASCPVAAPTPWPSRLRAVSHVADLGGQRYLVARAGDDDGGAVLVHLGSAGQMVLTKLPAWTEDVAVEGPARLRFLVTSQRPSWWTVDVTSPDAPTVGPPQAVTGLAPGEHPKGFATDGSRALIAMYRSAPPGSAERYHGDSALYEVPSGRRLTELAPTTVWLAECHERQCFGFGSPNGRAVHNEIVRFDDSGFATLADLGEPRCASGIASWRAGSGWQLAWFDEQQVQLLAVDLLSSRVRRASHPWPAGGCASVRHVRLDGRHGLHLEDRSRHSFVPVSPALQLGPAEELPLSRELRSHILAPLGGGGAFVVSFSSDSGMMHGPPDPSGMREYHHVWSFTGDAALLRRQGSGWRLQDVTPLPRSGDEGEFSTGLDAWALTRPGYAAALVTGSAGEEGASVLLRRPCP